MYILTLDLVFSSISVRAPDPTSDSLALFWVSPFFAFGVDPSTPKKSNSRLEEKLAEIGKNGRKRQQTVFGAAKGGMDDERNVYKLPSLNFSLHSLCPCAFLHEHARGP